MNYYPHYIDDFNGATRHLTRLERGIYRDMLDMYYEKELPLPADERQLFRRLIIRADDEIEAARAVLDEFFKLTDAGWVNARCTRVIDEYWAGAVARDAGGRAKAWQAADKAIRAANAVGDFDRARVRLADFVKRHGDTEASQAMAEMLASLTSPPVQPELGFDLSAFMAEGLDTSAVQSSDSRAATTSQPHPNRKVSAVEPRLANGEGNQNQNQNHKQSQNNPSQLPTLSEQPRATAVALSIACNKAGVRATPANPRLIALASQGVSVETIVAACEEAKSKGSVHLGYVVKVLETWAREAGSTRVVGAATQRHSSRKPTNDQACDWAAALTRKAHHEQRDTPDFIDLNPAPGLG